MAFVYRVKENELQQLPAPGKEIYLGQERLGEIPGLSEDGKYVYTPAFTQNEHHARLPPLSLMRVSLDQRNELKIIEDGDHRILDYSGADGEQGPDRQFSHLSHEWHESADSLIIDGTAASRKQFHGYRDQAG